LRGQGEGAAGTSPASSGNSNEKNLKDEKCFTATHHQLAFPTIAALSHADEHDAVL
jgi:hypothetical protein